MRNTRNTTFSKKYIIFFNCSVTRGIRYNSPKNPENWMLRVVLRVVLRVAFLVTRFCLAFALA